jgi:hypothetical protein
VDGGTLQWSSRPRPLPVLVPKPCASELTVSEPCPLLVYLNERDSFSAPGNPSATSGHCPLAERCPRLLGEDRTNINSAPVPFTPQFNARGDNIQLSGQSLARPWNNACIQRIGLPLRGSSMVGWQKDQTLSDARLSSWTGVGSLYLSIGTYEFCCPTPPKGGNTYSI